MSDQIADGGERVEPAKRRGWPKGKSRAPQAKPAPEAVKAAADRAQRPKIKARPNWESDDFIGVGMDNVDRLRVRSDKLDAIHRDGYALQWCTRAVRGQETPQELAQMEKGGWTPVHQSDFDGLLDGDFMPKGHDEPIVVDDCILMVRPVEIHAKSKLMERREANGRVQTIEAQMKTTGISGVSGANHPTATRGNMINKTVERIEIPE
jgi:hypothetical protein